MSFPPINASRLAIAKPAKNNDARANIAIAALYAHGVRDRYELHMIKEIMNWVAQ